ncbi:MAG: patatin-like phospholipase family protein, partial [Candidatus Eremiobacteraeota bacterium]|nr:patatin-like phospholipase family protein [Candidatus Eremiobacteraeota bacterium]
MKGGIASGIVYPAAVFEIAQGYVFKNVGGTSAGAIAAGLTAAAERRRARDGSMDGFVRIEAVPGYLSADQHLYKLFAPTSSTKSLYRTIVSLFGRPRFRPAIVAKWVGLVWAYPVSSIVGALAGSLFLGLVIRVHERGALYIVDIVLAIITIVVGITLGIGVALARDLFRRLPRNNYGMVKGVDDSNRSSLDALCTWLTRELELTAGLEPDDVPLTFGMLWDAKRDVKAEGPATKPLEPDVNLAMIATNVTWGRPYQFPNDVMFYYDPDELLAYFPHHVIDWMQKHPRKAKDDSERQHFEERAKQNKLPLPSAADLPVIVATRMSLAFPILL